MRDFGSLLRSVRALLLVLLPITSSVAAAADAADYARLGKDLTPIGAESAGNADGTIPAWEGGLTQPPAGWTPEKSYVDPFPGDKPLFTITGANVAQYEAKLTAGQVALRALPKPTAAGLMTETWDGSFLSPDLARVGGAWSQVSKQGFIEQSTGDAFVLHDLRKTKTK